MNNTKNIEIKFLTSHWSLEANSYYFCIPWPKKLEVEHIQGDQNVLTVLIVLISNH